MLHNVEMHDTVICTWIKGATSIRLTIICQLFLRNVLMKIRKKSMHSVGTSLATIERTSHCKG